MKKILIGFLLAVLFLGVGVRGDWFQWDCHAALAMTPGSDEILRFAQDDGMAEEASGAVSMVTEEIAEVGNITKPEDEETQYRLESVLEDQEVSGGVFDFLKVLVRVAVGRGVSANTIVLMFILPMVATMVAVLHYWSGVTGFGTFTPTMVAVTLVATGIFGGLALFAMILVISILTTYVFRKVRLHYWTRRSISLLFISLGTFGLMILSSFGGEMVNLTKISIFPVLMMIMLSEEFVRTQLSKSKNEAVRLTLGTLVLAVTGSFVMNWRRWQEVVLLYPEWMVLLVVGVNLVVGKYTGFRLTEYKRFGKALRKK